MKWSWKIGEYANIGVYVHWTFLILLAWVFGTYAMDGGGVAAASWGVLLVLSVFACVVLHEFGHALAARRYGIPTRDITLLPIGGVARLERMPDKPREELVVSLAGPLVNVVIAGLLAVVLALVPALSDWPRGIELMGGRSGFLPSLLAVNIGLVLFNLLPAFPMDGGRVLRALLAERLDYVRATSIAANVGQGMAILFGLLGLFSQAPLLLLVALFVYLGAQQEAQAVQVRSVLRGVPVRDAMITRFNAITEHDPLAAVVPMLISGEQQDFPVVDNSRVVGVLTRNDLVAAIAAGKLALPVANVMRRQCRVVDDRELLEDVFQGLQQGECPALPVLRDGRLVGMLTLENVGEWMMIQSALREAGGRHRDADLIRPQPEGTYRQAQYPLSSSG